MKTSEKFTCPCCGYKTLTEKPHDTYEICEVCFCEVDTTQQSNPGYKGGANPVSLREAQDNYKAYGACDIDNIDKVRKPTAKEAREHNWEFLDK